jgi:hypothetical protein
MEETDTRPASSRHFAKIVMADLEMIMPEPEFFKTGFPRTLQEFTI